MSRNYFEKFGFDENDFGCLVKEIADYIKELDINGCMFGQDDAHSSSYSKYEKFENDDLVEKHEREYVNGECVKKEDFQKNVGVENKCNCGDGICETPKCECGDCECKGDVTYSPEYTEELERKVKWMSEEIGRLSEANNRSETQIRVLTEENVDLKNKLNKIKNLF